MGIFDFFKKKTDIEEYCEEREKDKKRKEKTISKEKKVGTNNGEYLDAIAVLLSSNIPKIDKIKKVRELTGLGLKEALELVDGVKTTEIIMSDTEQVDEILNSGISKIEKIKKVREITGLGLKEAKDLVERK